MTGFGDQVARAVKALNEIGFDLGTYHISVWGALRIVIVVILVIAFARLLAKFARRLLRRIDSLDRTQQLLGEKIATIVVWGISFFVAIDVLGISLTALTVFSGAFGLAIGFGLQKTFGNLIAGIILLMDRSIKPGDVIAVNDGKGNSFGEVKKIGIRAVSVTTRDNREYLIPNENLMTQQVENWSYSSREVAINIPIGVAYGSDLDKVEKLLLEAINSTPRVLPFPSPGVLLSGFGASSIDMTMIVWIDDPEGGVGNVKSDVLWRVWRLFKEHGVEIPFPQSDVNLKDSAGLRALAAAVGTRGAEGD
ncbi:MAG: mechanosensitive ion channel protein MscS [Novosphingobium sp. 28-62-57]|uniref:mechanosensitive ion channel family protein n=1 Tax=unclassified Novosphingobium TaxID=2644732 RepID=UPI000BC76900|nr:MULTISPECIES: mechanosensitive ion channel domain-containing protein [unclassified Novosphingobium]OYW49029.1 MAG: mechanosensitive ion channel protein MscS [Novosphingobium sp. 12-62-10]OYZ09503.1 MAG: mechanosensitive ion channel protein MscS [Novosphingobium sp. 28-62-57]HQS70733.1 mechanosensitive ion channel [Novosphingobium sp.]